TDTTMRDGHQSLFATRMRTADMLPVAPHYASRLHNMFSMECWGGATFDVAMRFLYEDPWQRLRDLRERMPNLLLQMLLRSSNAVGYTNYSDNVVKFFVEQAAKEGIDLFRVFDSLNWVDNMRVAMDAVIDTGKLCEGVICYTGDVFDDTRAKYNLKYYVDMAKQLEAAGAHILGIKDMAGICKPNAIRALIAALREEISLPIHFHTHDTSGISAATVLAAVDAGVDAVDAAMDSMSGLTSQPSLGSIAAALRGTERDSGLDEGALRDIANYWEGVRNLYSPFESEIKSSTSDVYQHEMPGGQYTNLREQARAMGLDHRWPEVSKMYADVNKLFGDIVKVTPTSKVVGDMALFLVANDFTCEDVLSGERDISYPDSVISLFKGELGFPPDGFPADVSRAILREDGPAKYRPGDQLPPVDLEATRASLAEALEMEIDDAQLAAHLMYPKVHKDFIKVQQSYGDLSKLPTSAFFYGLSPSEEINVDLDQGKTLIIHQLGVSDSREEGAKRVSFELNGQPRNVRIAEEGAAVSSARPKAEDNNPAHVPAPMPGMIVTLSVSVGQSVEAGDPLLSIEAMKMETQLRSERSGKIKQIHVKPGDTVAAHDLLIEFE
ncbi:MAG: pyruvate carboxylase subunit B, partial [Gammaproteobacteria bacterium]|nr:pyruvate carboxylase subunit B [Gammaproteobacteria bacterium]